jgi:hypothetical protein
MRGKLGKEQREEEERDAGMGEEISRASGSGPMSAEILKWGI